MTKTKRKGGTKPKLTIAMVEEAARKAGGLKTLAARILKVGRSTLYRFIDAHPQLKEVFEEVDEEMGDIAEHKLFELIRDGDGQAIRFYLETKHKHRGYTRRVENTGKDGEPIQVQSADERNAKLRDFSDDELRRLADELERREKQK